MARSNVDIVHKPWHGEEPDELRETVGALAAVGGDIHRARNANIAVGAWLEQLSDPDPCSQPTPHFKLQAPYRSTKQRLHP